MRLRSLLLVSMVSSSFLFACSDEEDDDKDPTDPPKPVEQINIQVDMNRDGAIDATDDELEGAWTPQAGAVFLANLDDDDGDGIRDGEDNWVNIVLGQNDADAWDLARIKVVAWEEVPEGATGYLTVDPLALPHIRLYKVAPDGNFWLVLDQATPCDASPDPVCDATVSFPTAELLSGVELAIEGKRIPGQPESKSFNPATQVEEPWWGYLELRFAIHDPANNQPIVTETNPDGFDVAHMRVAPWIMTGNLTPGIDNIFANTPSTTFISGMEAATNDAGVPFWKINTWTDHWTEDWMILGAMSMPAIDGGGAMQSIKLAYPRPWGRQNIDTALPVNWLAEHFLLPDAGYAVVYNAPHTGDSYDSGGNHDLIPPYENPANGQSYPYGRIIHGSGVLQETQNFYEMQLVQSPKLVLDTSWLIVGHVDEAFSYAPAATERGWKLLVGSPRLAKSMLETWQQQGHGSVQMFVGKEWQPGSPAAVSIDEVLADADIMSWSEQGQAEIDSMLNILRTEVGLADDEIIEVPFLFERLSGALVAFNPGTVNARIRNDHIVFPDPFGPSINGVDGFKQDLIDRFATPALGLGAEGQGLKVFFTDNWDWYHVLLGEVHCGSNFIAHIQPEVKWWEAAE